MKETDTRIINRRGTKSFRLRGDECDDDEIFRDGRLRGDILTMILFQNSTVHPTNEEITCVLGL